MRRERLDAHARSFAQVETFLEHLEKHATLPVAEAKVLHRVVKQVASLAAESRKSMERQRAPIDEQAVNVRKQ